MTDYPEKGAMIEVAYPFVRTAFGEFDGDGYSDTISWKPGIRYVDKCVSAYVEPNPEAVADAMGTMILTVIDTFKPGKFQTRVFFTRKWRDPDGREFGKGACRVMIVSQFNARCRGFMHEYRMATTDETLSEIDALKKAA